MPGSCAALGRDDEGGHGRDGGGGEVDAAGQHGQGLAAGEHRERDGKLHGVGDPALVDDARPEDLQDDDEQEQQDDSGTRGWSAMKRRGGGRGWSGAAVMVMACVPAWREGAEHDDDDHDRALDDRGHVRVDGEEGQVGADEAQDEHRDDRPEEAAAAAAEDDAAEHDGRDGGEEVGAGDRLADAGGMVTREPPWRRTGRRWRRRRRGCATGTPERKAASGSSRWRRSRGRAATGGAAPRPARQTTRTTSAFGIRRAHQSRDAPVPMISAARARRRRRGRSG